MTTRNLGLRIAKYAPKGISPHKIRHSYASELYKRSRDLRLVQETLGHTSIQTTEIYLHTELDERRKTYRECFPLAAGVDDTGLICEDDGDPVASE